MHAADICLPRLGTSLCHPEGSTPTWRLVIHHHPTRSSVITSRNLRSFQTVSGHQGHAQSCTTRRRGSGDSHPHHQEPLLACHFLALGQDHPSSLSLSEAPSKKKPPPFCSLSAPGNWGLFFQEMEQRTPTTTENLIHP